MPKRTGFVRNPAEVITLGVAIAILGATAVTAGNAGTDSIVSADSGSEPQSGALGDPGVTGPYVSGRSSARASVDGFDSEPEPRGDASTGPSSTSSSRPRSPSWMGTTAPSMEATALSPFLPGPLAPTVGKSPSRVVGGGAGPGTPSRGPGPSPAPGSDATSEPPSGPDNTATPSPSETTTPTPDPSTEVPPTGTPPVTTSPEGGQPSTPPAEGDGSPESGTVTTPDVGQPTGTPTLSTPTASPEVVNGASPTAASQEGGVATSTAAAAQASAPENPVQADRLP